MVVSTSAAIDQPEIHLLPERSASLILWLLVLPPIVAGASGVGVARVLGLAIGLTWLTLIPVSLTQQRRFAPLLSATAGIGLLATVVLLPFDSPSFVVDLWSTLLMSLTAFPKERRRP